jgi:hypothetical protein
MLASSFSLTLVIIQTLMNPFLFLPHEHKFWGPQVSSVAEGFEAVARVGNMPGRLQGPSAWPGLFIKMLGLGFGKSMFT